MRPPRSRTPRIDFGSTETLRALILNATALVTTLLVLRFATLLITDSAEGTIPGYIQLVTTPFVWPFVFIPPLATYIVQDARLIDLLVIPAVAVIGIFIAGVLTGWRDTEPTRRYHSALRD
jgi:K+-sensing histidine kinase KdpD